MKEYIKKFANPAAADQYAIKDIPFITSVDGDPIQNLHCNLSGKKLVNVSGTVEVQSAGPEMVDLGLSVKWASANLGAACENTAESWYGHYYMWGDSEPTDNRNCSWNNYKWGTEGNLTKYNSTDSKTTLEASDDPATVAYGANYHSPTSSQIQELLTLSNTWITNYNGITGLNGRVFTGTNGNTIFIPAAGLRNNSNFYGVGSACNFWSGSLYTDYIYGAFRVYSDNGSPELSSSERFTGFSVRAVQHVSNS